MHLGWLSMRCRCAMCHTHDPFLTKAETRKNGLKQYVETMAALTSSLIDIPYNQEGEADNKRDAQQHQNYA